MSVAVPETIQDPAERLFREDLTQCPYCAGEDRGYWRVLQVDWPIALFEISAPPASGPACFCLRFELSGYPQAPTARPWDPTRSEPLAVASWPTGGERLRRAFNPEWNTSCLYLPVDRVALEGHDGWRQLPRSRAWDPAGDITQYLAMVHELLNDGGYGGLRG